MDKKRTKNQSRKGRPSQPQLEAVSEAEDEHLSGTSSFHESIAPPPAEPASPTPTVPESRSQGQKSAGHELGFFDRSPRQRTAMGNYIVPEGGEPLTRLEAYPSAGPADHTLPPVNLYLHKNPEWSIPIRCLYQFKGSCAPPPNTYDVPDMVAINQKTRFSFGRRLKHNRKLVAGPCRRGPTYNVRNYAVGKAGPKYSVPRAARGKVVTGPPNSLITPDDTPGYRRSEAEPFDDSLTRPRAPQALITSRPLAKLGDKKPGPATYSLPDKSEGPQHSFGLALKTQRHDIAQPAPNTYYPKPHLGDAPKFSIVSRKIPKEPRRAPSPFAYMREREYFHKEGIHMGFILPERPPDKVPPCTAYTLRTDKVGPPCASIKSRVKIPFPCSLNAMDAAVGISPGPAAHNLRRFPLRRDGIRIKTRLQPPNDGPRPGPADHGRIEPDPLSTKPKAPAYSLRPMWKEAKRDKNPGPAAYGVPEVEKGPAWTMRQKTQALENKSLVPAPNAYIPEQGCTRFGPGRSRVWGISMSSRHTPWQYAGCKIHPNAGIDVYPFLYS